jgi:hypothetical protein
MDCSQRETNGGRLASRFDEPQQSEGRASLVPLLQYSARNSWERHKLVPPLISGRYKQPRSVGRGFQIRQLLLSPRHVRRASATQFSELALSADVRFRGSDLRPIAST